MRDLTIPPRLRWSCRRGMLELDVLLGDFLNQAYVDLCESDQIAFTHLLACEDQDLFMWLTGKTVPTNPHHLSIVDKVRSHARYKHSL